MMKADYKLWNLWCKHSDQPLHMTIIFILTLRFSAVPSYVGSKAQARSNTSHYKTEAVSSVETLILAIIRIFTSKANVNVFFTAVSFSDIKCINGNDFFSNLFVVISKLENKWSVKWRMRNKRSQAYNGIKCFKYKVDYLIKS